LFAASRLKTPDAILFGTTIASLQPYPMAESGKGASNKLVAFSALKKDGWIV
jgi:hypothetical protein